jgi:hypothetical protein
VHRGERGATWRANELRQRRFLLRRQLRRIEHRVLCLSGLAVPRRELLVGRRDCGSELQRRGLVPGALDDGVQSLCLRRDRLQDQLHF